MDDYRQSEPMGAGIHGRGGISAEPGDDLGLAAPQDVAHLARLAMPVTGESQGGGVGASRERHFGDRVEFIPGLRHEITLQPDAGADHADLGLRLDGAYGVGDGQQGVDMAGGASPGQDDMDRFGMHSHELSATWTVMTRAWRWRP